MSSVANYTFRRGNIGGFVQLDGDRIILVATAQHCIILFERDNYSNRTLAGHCETQGAGDGNSSTAGLNSPSVIIKDTRNSSYVIVADTNNHRVVSVNVETGYISTILTLIEKPHALLWIKQKLLVASTRFLNLLEWNNQSNIPTVKILNQHPTPDNHYREFSKVVFKDFYGLEFINPEWIIATQKTGKKLTILNIESKTSVPVCVGDGACTSSSDNFDNMYSTIVTNDGLYASGHGGIYKLTGKL